MTFEIFIPPELLKDIPPPEPLKKRKRRTKWLGSIPSNQKQAFLEDVKRLRQDHS